MYDINFSAEVYRKLYLIREFETECIKLYRQGLIRGYFHPYLGEEAIAVGVCAALSKNDYIVSTHRGHGHCIANGASIDKMIAELLGKKDGYCKGLGGSMHIADTTKGNLGANGIVGAGIPIGVGAALGSKIKKDGKVTVTFSSDGSVNNGVFCEALNLSAAWNLPFILVIENNQYAVSTPISQSTRESELYKRGESLGVRSKRLDGNDVFEVYEEAQLAINECRNGEGPYLLEAVTYRHGGHHVNDPGKYLPKEELDFYLNNDPLIRCKKFLIENSDFVESDILEIEASVRSEINNAIDYAKQNTELTKMEFLNFIENY